MITKLDIRPIGFFDSGVGGLSVYSKFKEIMPFESTIYFGDLLHLPYGNKSVEELVFYARKILDYFKSRDVKAVIIACNTSSAQVYDIIKNEYDFKIYPIIQSCAKVISEYGYKKIGVFATEGTIKSHKYAQELKLYNKYIEVKEIAQKNWVSIVEGTVDNINNAKKNIKNDLQEMIDFNPDKIILGCTHYPFLINELSKYMDINLFIDPSEIFVKYIQQDLSVLSLNSNAEPKEEFFVSYNPEKFYNNAKIFYNLNQKPKLLNIFD